MNEVNKTLYIPLFGKSFVSKKGIIINDKKAEEIWDEVNFKLKSKSKSKYLAYYMGVRSSVFDSWVKDELEENCVVIHLGCGLDSRVLRINSTSLWYDIDFPSVIEERKKYYSESNSYKMISSDVRDSKWLDKVTKKDKAIVVLEGISMYLTNEELKELLSNISKSFNRVVLMMDCYSLLAAKLSKHKNPVKDVGVNLVYGLDDPKLVENEELKFVKEKEIVPSKYFDELKGIEKTLFKKLYAGNFSKKLYKLYVFKK